MKPVYIYIAAVLIGCVNPAIGWSIFSHFFIGAFTSRPKTYWGLFVLFLLGTFGSVIGLSAAMAAAVLSVHTFLFEAGLVYRGVGILWRVVAHYNRVRQQQASIAAEVLFYGWVALSAPVASLGILLANVFFVIGFNLLLTPLVLRARLATMTTLGVAFQALMFFGAPWVSSLAFLAQSILSVFVFLDAVRRPRYRVLEAEERRRVLIVQAKKIAKKGDLDEIVDFLNTPGMFVVVKEVVFEELQRLNKGELLKNLANHDCVNAELCMRLIRKFRRTEGAMGLVKTLVCSFRWINGDGLSFLEELKSPNSNLRDLYRYIGLTEEGEYFPYSHPVADAMRILQLRTKINNDVLPSTNADDREMMRRARSRIEKNNEEPRLKELFNQKGGLLGVEKEIKGRLLGKIYSSLESDLNDSDSVKKNNAKKIRDCIEQKRSALIDGEEDALGVLRGLIADNNTVSPIVAWRMFDPKADYSGYCSFLVPSDSHERAYTVREAVDEAKTEAEASSIVRHDNAYCYLYAVCKDDDNNNQDAFEQYVGMLSSAGRSNNHDELFGVDKHTCFPGFRTHMGDFLGGSFESVLKGIVSDKIQIVFKDILQSPLLTKEEKTDFYDALMLLEGKDALTLLRHKYHFVSDILFDQKVTNDKVERLMKCRKVLAEELFLDGQGECRPVEVLRAMLEERKISVDGVENFSDYVWYYLLKLESKHERLAALYADCVINAGGEIVPMGSDNPFSGFDNWEQYQINQVDKQPNLLAKKQATSNFIQKNLCCALFEHLKSSDSVPNENVIEDYVFEFKYKNQDLWKPENLTTLKERLLAAHPRTPAEPVAFSDTTGVPHSGVSGDLSNVAGSHITTP